MNKKADLVIKNGEIYTVDEMRRQAKAIAIKDDKIIYVGSNDEVSRYIDNNTIIIDAGERLILPGFIDPHTHLIMSYSKLVWADLSSVNSLESLGKTLRKYYEDNPGREFIGGFGWSYEIFRERGLSPHKSILDKIIADKAVLITDDTGHIGLANSMFIEKAVEKLSNDELRYGGMILDEDKGGPTGVFIDVFNLPLNKIMSFDRDRFRGILMGMDKAVRLGITTLCDALVGFDEINIYRRLYEEEKLKVRVRLAFYYHEKTADQLSKYKEISKKFKSNEWLKANCIKLFLDGVVESHTAAFYEPYNDEPSTRGELLFKYNEFKKIVAELDAQGFQIVTHALGDYAVGVVLDAYQSLSTDGDISDKRHRIEHVEFIHPKDLRRLSKIKPVIVMNPSHATISPSYKSYAGDRVEYSFAWKSVGDTGIKLAFASDWPVVDLNPIYGIHDAVNRDKYPYAVNEKISVEKAVEYYTINAAYAIFEENNLGSIEIGKKADIIMLSQNIFEIEKSQIMDTEVLMTIINGKIVYRDSRI